MPDTSVLIAAIALTFIVSLGLVLLSYLEHSRNVRHSTILTLFLSLNLFVLDIAQTRT